MLKRITYALSVLSRHKYVRLLSIMVVISAIVFAVVTYTDKSVAETFVTQFGTATTKGQVDALISDFEDSMAEDAVMFCRDYILSLPAVSEMSYELEYCVYDDYEARGLFKSKTTAEFREVTIKLNPKSSKIEVIEVTNLYGIVL